MKLRAKPIDLEAGGKAIVILNKNDADYLGVHDLDRVIIKKGNMQKIAIVDVTKKFVKQGGLITNDVINGFFSLKKNEQIDISLANPPESVNFIKQKLKGARLDYERMKAVVLDVVEKHLSDIEITGFVTALHTYGITMEEKEALSRAMIETGKKINFRGVTVDKHSVGGIPGDKTSLLAVPIIAASGLTIPKTSSRAITSPAGTADRMEVLAPVDFKINEIKRIVKRTKGCLVWGGSLDLAPADDAFIQVEYPLGIDPLMLPSIMSKKRAISANYIIIDIPTGRGAKIKTIGTAHELSSDFIELGRRLGMHVACAITYGEQPLGYSIGPALEAQEALQTLYGNGPEDLIEKVSHIAGILFDMVSRSKCSGKNHALHILKSGKALKKFRQIIEAQGGNPKIKPDDIGLGNKTTEIKSRNSGRVFWIKNAEISELAKQAGAPKDKTAGIKLSVKINSPVKKGDTLFTIYSNSNTKLNTAAELSKIYEPIIVGKKLEEKMLLDKVPSKLPHRRLFMLER